MIERISYQNMPYPGIFCVANDNYALIPNNCTPNFEAKIKEILDVDTQKISMYDTSLLKIFCAANNNTLIASSLIGRDEKKVLSDVFKDLILLDRKYTAIGNLVLLNDKGCACSPLIYDELSKHMNAKPLLVLNSDLVGSICFANNQGFLAHMNASKQDLKNLESILKVKGDVGTVNFGDPFVSSGIVGNKNGLLVGDMTTGPELNRIDDIFILSQR